MDNGQRRKGAGVAVSFLGLIGPACAWTVCVFAASLAVCKYSGRSVLAGSWEKSAQGRDAGRAGAARARREKSAIRRPVCLIFSGAHPEFCTHETRRARMYIAASHLPIHMMSRSACCCLTICFWSKPEIYFEATHACSKFKTELNELMLEIFLEFEAQRRWNLRAALTLQSRQEEKVRTLWVRGCGWNFNFLLQSTMRKLSRTPFFVDTMLNH